MLHGVSNIRSLDQVLNNNCRLAIRCISLTLVSTVTFVSMEGSVPADKNKGTELATDRDT